MGLVSIFPILIEGKVFQQQRLFGFGHPPDGLLHKLFAPHHFFQSFDFVPQFSILGFVLIFIDFPLLLNDHDDCTAEIDHSDETHEGVDDRNCCEVRHHIVV